MKSSIAAKTAWTPPSPSSPAATVTGRGPRKFQGLSRDVESDLIRQAQETKNEFATQRLISSYEAFIRKQTNRFANQYGLDHEDMYQEGVIGFIKAIERFDLSSGLRLSTYAIHWVKAQAFEYISKNNSLDKLPMRVPSNVRLKLKLLNDYLHANHLQDAQLTQDQMVEIGIKIDASVPDLLTYRQLFNKGERVSIDAPIGNDAEGGSRTYGDVIPDNGPSPFDIVNEGMGRELVMQIIESAGLKEREMDILTRRNLVDTPETLEVLGEEYGVSRERIRQIEAKALDKLKKAAMIYMRRQFGSEKGGMMALGIL